MTTTHSLLEKCGFIDADHVRRVVLECGGHYPDPNRRDAFAILQCQRSLECKLKREGRIPEPPPQEEQE